MDTITQAPLVGIERLRAFKFLNSLSDDDLAAYLPRIGEEQRPRNEVIYREGEPGDRFYMVEAGQAAVHRRVEEGEEFLGYFGPGDFFGQQSLLHDEPRSNTVDVVVQATLLYLYKEDFLELCSAHPGVRAVLERIAAERARRRAFHFPGRRRDEALVIATHRHPLWLALKMLRWSLIVLPVWFVAGFLLGLLAWWAHVLIALVYLGGLAWHFLDWRNDWFIVTSKRVLHREAVVLLFDQEEEAPLARITNVTSEVWGVIGNFLDIGTVTIQTAAGGGRIVFNFAPHFRRIRDAIEQENQRAQLRLRHDQTSRLRDGIRRDLLHEMGVLEEPPAPGEAWAVARRERKGALSRALGGLSLLPPTYMKRGGDTIWRKHVLLLYLDLVGPTLTFAVLVAFTLLMALGRDVAGLSLPLPVVLVVAVVGMVGVGVWFWYRYRNWENDIYVLTADQLIDSERKPFWLEEKVRIASLGQVQNVRYERKTLIENIFDYGTVLIETAGPAEGGLTFDYIPGPRRAQAEIMDAVERFRERQRGAEREQRRREFLDWFGEYHRLITEGEPEA